MYELIQTIQASGTPYEIGYIHGTLAKEKILNNIKVYDEMFQQWSKINWEQAKERAKKYKKYVEEEPELLEEMKGIAEGAGLEFEDIMALNARSEVVFAENVMSDACTSFSVLPEASKNQHTYIGQNWDWRAGSIDNLIILKIKQENKPSIFMVTEAGIIGKIGFNSKGLGVCLNALSVVGKAEGMPLHVTLRRILNSNTINEALMKINGIKNAGPGNYLMAQNDGCTLTVEKTPEAWDFILSENGVLMHTNHIVSDVLRAKVKDQGPTVFPNTILRYDVMKRLLQRESGNIDVEYIKSCLRTHCQFPDGICHHTNETLPLANRLTTVFSIIMDLNTSEVWLTLGPPCESEYTHYKVSFD